MLQLKFSCHTQILVAAINFFSVHLYVCSSLTYLNKYMNKDYNITNNQNVCKIFVYMYI